MTTKTHGTTPVRKSSRAVAEAAMAVAFLWAEARSKDPSTKVGAAVVDPRTGGLFLGYNGFPAGVPDLEEVWQRRTDDAPTRDVDPYHWMLTKYDLVVHAEQNAVRKALTAGVDLALATLVCTMIPCPRCMLTEVVACGIRTVVFADDHYHAQTDRDAWLTREVARLGGVRLVHVDRAGKVLDGTR